FARASARRSASAIWSDVPDRNNPPCELHRQWRRPASRGLLHTALSQSDEWRRESVLWLAKRDVARSAAIVLAARRGGIRVWNDSSKLSRSARAGSRTSQHFQSWGTPKGSHSARRTDRKHPAKSRSFDREGHLGGEGA